MLFGPLVLRFRLGLFSLSERVTIPVLFRQPGQKAIRGSTEIATWAVLEGRDSQSYDGVLRSPRPDSSQVEEWTKHGFKLMEFYRASLIEECFQNEQLLMTFVPKALRKFPWLAKSTARWFLRRFATKYRDQSASLEEARSSVRTIESALSDGRVYLVRETFSFADIVVAVGLSKVMLVDDAYYPVHTLIRQHFQSLSQEFELNYPLAKAFKDRIFTEHFPHALIRTHLNVR